MTDLLFVVYGMTCFMQAGSGEGVELSTHTREAKFAETSDSAPAFRYIMS